MSLNQIRVLILAAETVLTAPVDLAVLHAAFDSVSRGWMIRAALGTGGRLRRSEVIVGGEYNATIATPEL